MNNFFTRTITGTLFVALLIVSILFHPLTFGILFLAINMVALIEFYNISRLTKAKPQIVYGTLVASFTFLLAFVSNYFRLGNTLTFLAIPLVSFVFIWELYRKHKYPILNIGLTLFGFFYVTLPLFLLNYIVFFNGEFLKCPVIKETFPFQSSNLSIPDCKKVTIKNRSIKTSVG